MREQIIRAAFSALAAAVTLSMSQEWMTWAIEQRKPWKIIPSLILGAFSLFEAHQVWRRGELMLRVYDGK